MGLRLYVGAVRQAGRMQNSSGKEDLHSFSRCYFSVPEKGGRYARKNAQYAFLVI